MRKTTAGILPLIGAVIVFGVSIFNAAMVMETSLIILVLLSLYAFIFTRNS